MTSVPELTLSTALLLLRDFLKGETTREPLYGCSCCSTVALVHVRAVVVSITPIAIGEVKREVTPAPPPQIIQIPRKQMCREPESNWRYQVFQI